MKHIPSTVVFAALLIIFAEWPSVQSWSMLTPTHHYLVHGLYLLAGGLFGLQTSAWMVHPAPLSLEESGVSS